MDNYTPNGRNKERIPIVLDNLRKIWEKNPDLRFFQLLDMIGFSSRNDYFFLEDDEMNRILEGCIEETAK